MNAFRWIALILGLLALLGNAGAMAVAGGNTTRLLMTFAGASLVAWAVYGWYSARR